MASFPPVIMFFLNLWFFVTDWLNKYGGWLLVVIAVAGFLFALRVWYLAMLALP